MILSNNIFTILTTIFVFIYFIFNIQNLSATHVKNGMIIDFIFILLITSFYFLPFWQARYLTDYQISELNIEENFLENTLNFKDLFITKNDSVFILEIGLPVILMLAFSVMTFRLLEDNQKEYLFLIFSGAICVWMSTKYFPWKWLPEVFYVLQYPWKIMAFSSFFFSIICGINMTKVIKKFNIKDVLIIGVICLLYIFSRYGIIQYRENVTRIEEEPVATVTGQKNQEILGMGKLECLPSKAYENTFYIATREAEIMILEGNCDIQNETKLHNYLNCKIKTYDERVTLELPFIYYPGYTVRLDGIIMETFETSNGFLGLNLNGNESGNLEVKYTGNNLMHFSKIISLTSFVVFMIYVWRRR